MGRWAARVAAACCEAVWLCEFPCGVSVAHPAFPNPCEQWWQQAGLTLDGRLASQVEEEEGAYGAQPQQQQYQRQASGGWAAQAALQAAPQQQQQQQQQQQGYGYQQAAAPQQAAPQAAQLGTLLQQLLAGAGQGAGAQQQGYGWQQGGGGGLLANPAFQQLVQQLPGEQQAQVIQLAQAMPPGEQAQFLALLQRTAPAGVQQAAQAPQPQPQAQPAYGAFPQQQQQAQQQQFGGWQQAQQQAAAQQAQQQAQQQAAQQQAAQQQAAAAWPGAARQLLEGLATLPHAAVILQQPPPALYQASAALRVATLDCRFIFCKLLLCQSRHLTPAPLPLSPPPALPLQGPPLIDLPTIARRLANGQYARPMELATDAGRMFGTYASGAWRGPRGQAAGSAGAESAGAGAALLCGSCRLPPCFTRVAALLSCPPPSLLSPPGSPFPAPPLPLSRWCSLPRWQPAAPGAAADAGGV